MGGMESTKRKMVTYDILGKALTFFPFFPRMTENPSRVLQWHDLTSVSKGFWFDHQGKQ